MPPFHSAVDRAISYLDPNDGFLGVCDFFVSGRYDLPCRQLGFLRRFFWRSAKPCALFYDAASGSARIRAACISISTYQRSDVCCCRATFDTDNIDVGPERRAYLDHRLSRVWEVNSQVGACIPPTAVTTCVIHGVVIVPLQHHLYPLYTSPARKILCQGHSSVMHRQVDKSSCVLLGARGGEYPSNPDRPLHAPT